MADEPGHTVRRRHQGDPLPHWDTWDPRPGQTAYYGPKIVDIHPHLLPDIHPWWRWWTASPTNPLWFHSGCLSQYQNFYNASLYNFPSVGHINPPGSRVNTVASPKFFWLEEVAPPTGQPLNPHPMSLGADFMVGGPILMNHFDNWCQNRRTTMPVQIPDHETWQPTFPFQNSQPPFTALRYSTEFQIQRPPLYGTSSVASNLQSFMVVVEATQ